MDFSHIRRGSQEKHRELEIMGKGGWKIVLNITLKILAKLGGVLFLYVSLLSYVWGAKIIVCTPVLKLIKLSLKQFFKV